VHEILYHNDQHCDDGGDGSEFATCPFGTDCADCGPRVPTHQYECKQVDFGVRRDRSRNRRELGYFENQACESLREDYDGMVYGDCFLSFYDISRYNEKDFTFDQRRVSSETYICISRYPPPMPPQAPPPPDPFWTTDVAIDVLTSAVAANPGVAEGALHDAVAVAVRSIVPDAIVNLASTATVPGSGRRLQAQSYACDPAHCNQDGACDSEAKTRITFLVAFPSGGVTAVQRAEVEAALANAMAQFKAALGADALCGAGNTAFVEEVLNPPPSSPSPPPPSPPPSPPPPSPPAGTLAVINMFTIGGFATCDVHELLYLADPKGVVTYGLLYAKVDGGGTCQTDFAYPDWPAVELLGSAVPEFTNPPISATVSTIADSSSGVTKHYLTINGCLAYYYWSGGALGAHSAGTAYDGISSVWPAFSQSGVRMGSAEVNCLHDSPPPPPPSVGDITTVDLEAEPSHAGQSCTPQTTALLFADGLNAPAYPLIYAYSFPFPSGPNYFLCETGSSGTATVFGVWEPVQLPSGLVPDSNGASVSATFGVVGTDPYYLCVNHAVPAANVCCLAYYHTGASDFATAYGFMDAIWPIIGTDGQPMEAECTRPYDVLQDLNCNTYPFDASDDDDYPDFPLVNPSTEANAQACMDACTAYTFFGGCNMVTYSTTSGACQKHRFGSDGDSLYVSDDCASDTDYDTYIHTAVVVVHGSAGRRRRLEGEAEAEGTGLVN
jgi:hypothetical protein